MTKDKPVLKQDFPELSAAERAVVGEPSDYAWDDSLDLPARRRPETQQFSLRIERKLYETLQAMSEQGNRTFSDVARGALAHYVEGGATVENVQISYGNAAGHLEALVVQVAGKTPELSATRSLAGGVADRAWASPSGSWRETDAAELTPSS